MRRAPLAATIICLIFCSACTVTINPSGVTVHNNGQDIYSTNSQYKDTCPTIKESLLYDEKDITVTAKNVEYNTQWDAYVINVEIINNSENDITYSVNHIKVDGFSIDSYAHASIYSKCKDTAEIGFYRNDLQLASLSKIKELCFEIELCDESTDKTFAIVSADLKTEEYDGIENTFVFDGSEVYKNDSLIIYAKPNSRTNIDYPITLYAVNYSDKAISINYEDVAYNGEMVVEMCTGVYLLPNSQKVFEMNLFLFGDTDIAELSRVDFKLNICPRRYDGTVSSADSYKTPKITIEY